MTADLATSDAATARLFRERYSELVGLAGLLLDDAGAAEEVVQDAFARFHLSRHRIHDPDREVAYLRSIVCNLARGRIRRWVLERLRLSRGEPVGYEGRPYVEHGDWSWYTGTDVMRCPDGLYGVDDELDAVRAPDGDMGPIDRGSRPVGDRTAVYDRWAAECTLSDFAFTPRAWLLRDLRLLIVDELDNPETEQILASFEFVDRGADAVDTTDTSSPGAGGVDGTDPTG